MQRAGRTNPLRSLHPLPGSSENGPLRSQPTQRSWLRQVPSLPGPPKNINRVCLSFPPSDLCPLPLLSQVLTAGHTRVRTKSKRQNVAFPRQHFLPPSPSTGWSSALSHSLELESNAPACPWPKASLPARLRTGARTQGKVSNYQLHSFSCDRARQS